MIVWDDSIKVIMGIVIIVYGFLVGNSSHYNLFSMILSFGVLVVLPFYLFFFELGVYKYTFYEDNLTIRFLYGRKKVISKDKIVRIAKTDKRKRKEIEIHYKKSSKHSTRIIRIPVTSPAYSSDSLVSELSSLYLNR